MSAPYKTKLINPNRETLPWNAVDLDIEDLKASEEMKDLMIPPSFLKR